MTDCFQGFVLQQKKRSSTIEIPFIIRLITAYFQICVHLCPVTQLGPFSQAGVWYSLLRQTDVLRLRVTARPSPESGTKCEQRLK